MTEILKHFDIEYYKNKYPELKNFSKNKTTNHFLNIGLREKRIFNKKLENFNLTEYIYNIPQCNEMTYIEVCNHYLDVGINMKEIPEINIKVEPIKHIDNNNNNNFNNVNNIIKVNKKIIILTTIVILNLANMIKHHIKELNLECDIIFKLDNNCIDSNDIYLILFYDRKINNNLIPKYFIWYQIEQFNTSISLIEKFDDYSYNLMNNSLFILDFCENNINKYKDKVNKQIFYLPFPFYNNNNNNFTKEYDLVFFGAHNNRRQNILEKIKERLGNKYNIKILYGVFNEELNNYLLKSKYCINIHFYEDSELEIDRFNVCFNNNCYVLSEESNQISNNNSIYNNVKYFNLIKNIENENEINNMITCIEENLINYDNSYLEILKNKDILHNLSKFYFYRIFFNIKYINNFNDLKYKILYEINNDKPIVLTLIEDNYRYNLFKKQKNKIEHYIFPAIKQEIGQIGCLLSYISLMYNAKMKNLDNIMIIEDDCVFNDYFKINLEIIKDFIKEFDFDVINFYCCEILYENIIDIIDYKGIKFLKLKYMVGGVCNIYNKSIYDILINIDINYIINDFKFKNINYHWDRIINNKKDIIVYVPYPFNVDIQQIYSTINNGEDAYSFFKRTEEESKKNIKKFIDSRNITS